MAMTPSRRMTSGEFEISLWRMVRCFISMEKGYQQTYQGFNPRSSESYIIFEFIQGKNMERSVELARNIQRKVCNGANRPFTERRTNLKRE